MTKPINLNKIWTNIQKKIYLHKAKELAKQGFGSWFIYPEMIYSDETGDMMSVPNKDGTNRDIFLRKKRSKKWKKLTK